MFKSRYYIRPFRAAIRAASNSYTGVVMHLHIAFLFLPIIDAISWILDQVFFCIFVFICIFAFFLVLHFFRSSFTFSLFPPILGPLCNYRDFYCIFPLKNGPRVSRTTPFLAARGWVRTLGAMDSLGSCVVCNGPFFSGGGVC